MGDPQNTPTGLRLLRGLLRHSPFVLKNFKHYFQNLYRREILHTDIVAPYAAIFYTTHKCNLECTYCTQKEPDVFSQELPTDQTIALLRTIRRETDSILFTGGEPLLRRDFFRILEKANTAPFKSIIVQTNALLLKKLHREINDSPITSVCVSLDGIGETNDRIRGIKGYFDLAMQGIPLLRGKKVTISVTLNKLSAGELEKLAEMARGVGASVHFNILSQSLPFTHDADYAAMWPGRAELEEITRFVRDVLKRPAYEVDYIRKYYNNELTEEPPCVLGFLQVFVVSNGDVLTGCYPLKPVGNILRDRLETILASKAYVEQAEAMIRRECPGCTCGVESSLAMKHAGSSAFFELSRLLQPQKTSDKTIPAAAAAMEDAS